MVTVEPSKQSREGGPVAFGHLWVPVPGLGRGRCKWLAPGLQGGIGTFHCSTPDFTSPQVPCRPGQLTPLETRLKRLSSESSGALFTGWSQCGCYPLRPCAFCPRRRWGCARHVWGGLVVEDRSPAAGPDVSHGNIFVFWGFEGVVFASAL